MMNRGFYLFLIYSIICLSNNSITSFKIKRGLMSGKILYSQWLKSEKSKLVYKGRLSR